VVALCEGRRHDEPKPGEATGEVQFRYSGAISVEGSYQHFVGVGHHGDDDHAQATQEQRVVERLGQLDALLQSAHDCHERGREGVGGCVGVGGDWVVG
jgi:hypothetical protein